MKPELKLYAKKVMHNYLIGLGIYPNSSGYASIVEAVASAAERGVTGLQMIDIYKTTAQTLNKSVSAVERCIRTAFMKSNTENRLVRLNDYFGMPIYSEKYPPRSGELICLFAFKINNEFSIYSSQSSVFS